MTVNLSITNVEKNVQMLDGDGNMFRGVIITLSDGQKILLNNKTLPHCEVWLVPEAENTIWGQDANYKLVYPVNGAWDEDCFMKGIPARSAVVVDGRKVEGQINKKADCNLYTIRLISGRSDWI